MSSAISRKNTAGGGVRLAHHQGLSGVTSGPDFRHEGDLSEKDRAEGVGGLGTSARTKERMACATGIFEPAHVLRDAEQRDVHLLEHQSAFPGHIGGGRLGGRHDHGSIQRQGLDERKLRISRSRRKIDQKDIQIAPADVLHELLDGLHDHRPAPDHRRVVVHEEAHAHDLHPVRFQGYQRFTVQLGTALQAHHQRDTGSVDVAVHQAHSPRPALGGEHLGQCARQIDRKRTLAHATFARSDCDGVPNAARRGPRAGLVGARRRG